MSHRRVRPTTTIPLAFALCLLPGSATAQALSEEHRQAIDEICAPWAAEEGPGVSVAVIRGGKLTFAKGYGLAQLEYDIPIDTDTVFHVASVSKQFTAFCLVLLELDGALSLDDDVRKHVPWLHDFGETITIRHLLNHTSGLRDQWELLAISGYSLNDVLEQQHILRILRNQRELNFAPGSEYLYSNMGYTLAAQIVAEVSGKTLREFCEERIFAPLGMAETHFHSDNSHIVPQRAYSYARRGRGWKKAVLNYANVGATSLFTTASDLARWLANFGHGEVGGCEATSAQREQGLLTDGTRIPYALGVIIGNHGGRSTVSHSGGDAGFRSHVIYFPGEDLGLVVLANAASAGPAGIAKRIADALLPKLPAETVAEQASLAGSEREPVSIDAQSWERILGRYGKAGQPMVIVSQGGTGKVMIEVVGMGKGQLFALSASEFFARESPGVIRFQFVEDEELAQAVTMKLGSNPRSSDRVPDLAEDDAQLADWAGRYDCPELQVTYEIVVEGHRVLARHRRHGDIPLKVGGKDELIGQVFYFRSLRAQREDGKIIGFRLSSGRVRNLKFVRRD